jgi:hypothetical protein
MSVREEMLIELGRQIIATRRRVWDLERRGRNRSCFDDEELRRFRREYRDLLKQRKAIVAAVQMRAFE